MGVDYVPTSVTRQGGSGQIPQVPGMSVMPTTSMTPAGSPGGPIVNTGSNRAAVDPNVSAALNRINQRYDTLAQTENKPLTEDFARQQDNAASAISDANAGRQSALSEDLARRGIAGSGAETALRGSLDAASQRLQAKTRADIGIAGQHEQDVTDLARAGLTNQALGTVAQTAQLPAQLALQQQGLGLQQVQLQNQAANAEADRQMQLYLSLLNNPNANANLGGGSYYAPSGGGSLLGGGSNAPGTVGKYL